VGELEEKKKDRLLRKLNVHQTVARERGVLLLGKSQWKNTRGGKTGNVNRTGKKGTNPRNYAGPKKDVGKWGKQRTERGDAEDRGITK